MGKSGIIRPLYLLGFQIAPWIGFSVCPSRCKEVHTEGPRLYHLTRAIKASWHSASREENGSYEIDDVELEPSARRLQSLIPWRTARRVDHTTRAPVRAVMAVAALDRMNVGALCHSRALVISPAAILRPSRSWCHIGAYAGSAPTRGALSTIKLTLPLEPAGAADH
jgi:hypothetical protein